MEPMYSTVQLLLLGLDIETFHSIPYPLCGHIGQNLSTTESADATVRNSWDVNFA